jgi:hypothetical protein
MFFAKDEIIELEDNSKYLILDTAIIDNKYYYKIKKVNDALDKLIGDYKIISASNVDGELFIEEKLSDEEIQKLTELFES